MGELIIPGWKIIRVIGKGSFGCVYEVEKEDEFGGVAHSALKVISIPERDTDVEEYRQEGYDDKSLTALFRSQVEDITSEFRLMSKLKGCSNIVSFEDHWIVQHRDDPGYDIFIRMELLATLMKAYEQELAENGFNDRYVQRVGVDICRALERCGRHNIIHRDIKPQNIFVNEEGDFKLGDFGIAKTSDHTTRATKTGTYNYMAPEVYWGKPYNASVDLYSLGLVLYWMMNERRGPFMPLPPELPKPAQNAEAMDRRMHGEPLPAPKNGSDALKRIVLKACAYDPKDRYASPAELRRDLERAVAAKETETFAPPVKAVEPVSAEADERTVGAYRKETEDDRTVSVVSEPVKASETERPVPVAVQTPVADEIKTSQPKQAYEATVGAFRAETGKNVDTYEDGTVRIAADPVFEAGPAAYAEDADATVGLFAKKKPEAAKPSVKKEPERKTEPASKSEKPAEKPEPASKPEKPQGDRKTAGKGSKKTLLIVAAAAALAVIAAVVLIVVLAGKGKQSQQAEAPTAVPTSAPTDAPTAAPTPVLTKAPTPTKNPKVGDIVHFGSYEQDNNTSNGKEDIEWLVLAKEGDRVLVISRYALDCQQYNTSYTSVTWETCTLRKWLNETFINNAFSSKEQAMIHNTTVTADRNLKYSTFPGSDTTDKVFLLSIQEVDKYFSSDSARQCKGTDYCYAQGAYKGSNGNCPWWLRSPGHYSNYAADVLCDGSVYDYGYSVYNDRCAVRPALWIDLGS